ncbi:unnamed protein product [Notodromas monacha]|uniref:Beta-1,4-galactosyltransferase 3 n=1 Tax=Notodromas monacha TaxID=399045 RepID=A0A7R9BXE8_9CRUS|nr:unnamed protein product [Notodromas monacha]CAG0923553.1 unnamed protein product [Notodromas monacha]
MGPTADDLHFNRGQLLNIGTLEAEKHGDYHCFVYHDLDMIPEKGNTPYKCFPWPLHLALGVEKLQYKPFYRGMSGVAIVPKQLIHQVNGHSNNFWGWGGEDDDFLLRFNSQGFNVMHYPAEVGRYRSLPHVPASPSPNRYKILKKEGGKRDSGLSNVNYVLVQTRLHPLYTIYDVNLTLSVK